MHSSRMRTVRCSDRLCPPRGVSVRGVSSFADGKYQGVKKVTLVARLDISMRDRILTITCNSDPHISQLYI